MNALIPLLALAAPADDFDRNIDFQMRLNGTPSLAYAVVKNGRIVREGARGVIDLENEVPATTQSVYEIGSMTKQFTAAAVLLLVEDGKLDLAKPVREFVPGLPPAWQTLTLEQCLSHTAGLKDYLASYSLNNQDPVRLSAIVDRMGTLPLDFAPGTNWQYSNTGYVIATMAIERASRQTYADFLRDRIFKPLGMTQTMPSNPTQVIPHRVRGYAVAGPDKFTNAPVINPSLASGAGNLVSTLADLAKWDQAIQNRKIFKNAETHDRFQSPVKFSDGRTAGYGLGWFFATSNGQSIIEHGGNTAGFGANIYRIPGRQTTVIVLANLSVGGASISRSIAATLLADQNPLLNRRADPNPRRSLEVMRVLRRWSRGDFEMDMLAPSMQERLNTLRGVAERSALATLGRIVTGWEYLNGEQTPNGETARYAYRIGQAKAIMEYHFDRDGKITKFDQLYVSHK